MSARRLWLLLALAVTVAAFFALGLDRYLTLQAVQAELERLRALIAARPLASGAAFFVAYVAVTALSLPGATVMTLAAGALFGLGWGTLIVSFASSLGATAAFLIARWVARDWVARRFAGVVAAVDRGIERDGALYLASLRLVPVFPFFVINAALGLTAMRTWTFYWVSQLAMLPATVVYVNAGRAIGRIGSPGDLLSPPLLGAFAALAALPWVGRLGMARFRRWRALRGFARPRRFERDLVVIGGGSAGLVAAYVGALLRARVTLIERDRMGGDCLWRGCVPSKALIASARRAAAVRDAGRYGLRAPPVEVDFPAVMARVRAAIAAIEPHDSPERFTRLGVECVAGSARLVSPWTVAVGERSITTRAIIIATGSRPVVPPIPGIGEVPFRTSDDLWQIDALPQRLLVLGGGAIGCELAQAFARLGAEVTVVEMAAQLLPREEPEVAAAVARALQADGVRLLTASRVERFATRGTPAALVRRSGEGDEAWVGFDLALVATGRRPNTSGLGLEALGVPLAADGTIEVDSGLRSTRLPTVFACGDVAGPWQFTHAASHQAWHAAVNALAGGWWRLRVRDDGLPWAIFTDPEVARVGLDEATARRRGVAVEVTRYELAELDRAIVDGQTDGWVKVLTVPGRDRILGATIVGAHAGELITEFAAAIAARRGLASLTRGVRPYPTWSEANGHLAGAWRRGHASRRLLAWLERWHRWHRGA